MNVTRSMPAVALAALLAGCTTGGEGTSEPTPPPKYAAGPTEITIAIAAPLSGVFDGFGKQVLRGASTAVTDINEQGGLIGKRLVTVIDDDQCKADEAVTTAEDIVRERTVFVVGHFCSDASIAAAPIYQREGIIMMSPGTSSPAFTAEARPYIFRMFFTDDFQAVVAAQYVAMQYPGARVGIAEDGSTYGRLLAERMRSELAARNVDVLLTQQVTPGEKVYPALIDAVAQNDIDVLYYGGYHAEAAGIAVGLRERGLDTTLVGADALLTSEYTRLAGPAAEGTIITASPDLTTLPPGKAVSERLRASRQDPTGYVLYAYAAVEAWAQAVKIAGSINPNAVSEALHGNTFQTVIGKAQFDESGDLETPPIVIYHSTGGRFVQLWPQVGS